MNTHFEVRFPPRKGFPHIRTVGMCVRSTKKPGSTRFATLLVPLSTVTSQDARIAARPNRAAAITWFGRIGSFTIRQESAGPIVGFPVSQASSVRDRMVPPSLNNTPRHSLNSIRTYRRGLVASLGQLTSLEMFRAISQASAGGLPRFHQRLHPFPYLTGSRPRGPWPRRFAPDW